MKAVKKDKLPVMEEVLRKPHRGDSLSRGMILALGVRGSRVQIPDEPRLSFRLPLWLSW